MFKSSIVISSIIYLILGNIMLLFPASVSDLICYFIGSIIIIYGIMSIVSYSKTEEDTIISKVLLIIAIACILFGLFMLLRPKTFASIIPFTAGIFMLVESISKLKEAIELKKNNYDKWWMVLLFFIELLIFSLILVFNPFGALEVTIRFIGLMLIIKTLSDIWTFRTIKKAID